MDFAATDFGLALLIGTALGVAYMAALWWSVRHFASTGHPLGQLLGGALLRITMFVAVVHLVVDGSWERLAGVMLGFLVARTVATRLAQAPPVGPPVA